MDIKKLFSGAPATATICALCLLYYVAAAAQARSITNAVWDSRLGTAMVLYGPFVESEPWGWTRAVTAGFLHLDVTHVFVNVLMLALIGTEVERFVGTRAYALAYGAGLLGSSATVLALNFDTPTAGASGALYMLMAVLIAVAYRRHTDLRAPFALLALNLAYSLLAPNVSLWGHVGGMAVGVVLARPLTDPRPRVRVAAGAAGLAAAGAGLALVVAS